MRELLKKKLHKFWPFTSTTKQDSNLSASSMTETELSSYFSARYDGTDSSQKPQKSVVAYADSILNVAFLLSSVAAVFLDALFFYIYFIDEEKKCFSMDNKIKNAAIISRSVTDVIMVLQIAFQVYHSSLVTEPCAYSSLDLAPRDRTLFRRALYVNKRIPWMHVLVDFLALLPIPQIIILVLFANMKSSRYLEKRWAMNVLPLLQFVPRVIRIFLLCQKLSRSAAPNDITGAAWVKGAFNLFLFILASHVVGAFWFFFSVERELYCWQRACKYNSGCRANTFYCEDITGNERFVDKFCPTNPPDPTIFDFGIFVDAHQSGVSRVKDFPVKLLYCFSWGLRTLSSFGSNLNTSTYLCENVFAALVTIAGILLVVYLIGNLQVYLQSSTSRSEVRRRMMQSKEVEINSWIKDCGIQDLKKEILLFVRDKFDGNNDVNLKNLLAVFPPSCVLEIKKALCLHILLKVPGLENVGEVKLERMMEHMKPVVFEEQSYIVREGEPIDQLLVFTRGTGWAYSTVDGSTELLERGNLFGVQLLGWALGTLPATHLPLSGITVKSGTKMEAFALMAFDLMKGIPSS